jgi:polysaccharide export outer membrane protein
MLSRLSRVLHIGIVGVVLIVASCGSSGTRMISNKDGEVERGEFLFEDLPNIQESEDYLINYGDELDISFFYDKDYDLNDLKVRPDGKISLPYVGEVLAAGKSLAHVDSVITGAYAAIIRDPQITIMLKEFDESVVYILGEVEGQGAFELISGMTLLGALAQGRIDLSRADKGSVLVIRRVAHDHIVGMQFNMKQLTEGGRFDLDIPLKPNDIVYVPTSSLKKAQDFISTLYNIFVDPMNLYLRGWQVANVNVLYEYYQRMGTAD